MVPEFLFLFNVIIFNQQVRIIQFGNYILNEIVKD